MCIYKSIGKTNHDSCNFFVFIDTEEEYCYQCKAWDKAYLSKSLANYQNDKKCTEDISFAVEKKGGHVVCMRIL